MPHWAGPGQESSVGRFVGRGLARRRKEVHKRLWIGQSLHYCIFCAHEQAPVAISVMLHYDGGISHLFDEQAAEAVASEDDRAVRGLRILV